MSSTSLRYIPPCEGLYFFALLTAMIDGKEILQSTRIRHETELSTKFCQTAVYIYICRITWWAQVTITCSKLAMHPCSVKFDHTIATLYNRDSTCVLLWHSRQLDTINFYTIIYYNILLQGLSESSELTPFIVHLHEMWLASMCRYKNLIITIILLVLSLYTTLSC